MGGAKRQVLARAFFERSALVVAEQLLGKYLVRKDELGECAYQITETEAYDGPEDKASHASRGETPRTSVMFGPAGIWYVYLIYGMYDMLNIVSGQRGYPAAVLIRGLEGINGPGRLTKALNITKADFNGKPANKAAGLWVEDRGVRIPRARIRRTPRIGVPYAGEWKEKEYRFILLPEE